MAITVFRGMKPGSQILFAAFVIVASFLIFFALSIAAALPFVGISSMMESLSGADLSNHATINLLKYFQVVQSIGLFIIPPFIIGYLYEGSAFDYLTLNRKLNLSVISIGLLAVIASGPLIGYLGDLNSNMHFPPSMSGLEHWMRNMEDNADNLINQFIAVKTIWGTLFNIFMIAIIPALGEELLFRGVIQKIFTQMTHNYHLGIWISALLFSALHMQFYGFIPRMLLGALFGYLLVFTGSIWLPILAHFLNNFVGVLSLQAENSGSEAMSKASHYADSISTSPVLAALSLVVVVLLLYSLKKKPGIGLSN